MNSELLSLDSLGHKYGTDKASGQHDYLGFYETYLSSLRHREVKILEIGIQFGSSLRMWEEYFPRGTVVGVDIHPGVKTFTGERISTEIIDQSNLDDLTQLGVKHGPFDVIVEDGSHLWEHQISTFKTLFPFVKSAGMFIIEDLQTNYGGLAASYRGVSGISCMDYLKKLVDLKVADDQIDILEEADPFLRAYGRRVEFVTFLRRACIIKKGTRQASSAVYLPGSKAPDSAAIPLVEAADGARPIPLSIGCHIGTIGDWFSDTGSIRSLDAAENIQGFLLHCPELPPGALEYRARLADGTWTGWVSGAGFAGTMGISQSLQGFSLRIAGDLGRRFTLECFGLFRGERNPSRAGNGEECVPRSSNGELYGMQCRLSTRQA